MPFYLHFPAGDASEGSSNARATCATGPQGFRKHFMSRKLDCDNQPPNPDILFQRCFTANVTSVKVESPPVGCWETSCFKNGNQQPKEPVNLEADCAARGATDTGSCGWHNVVYRGVVVIECSKYYVVLIGGLWGRKEPLECCRTNLESTNKEGSDINECLHALRFSPHDRVCKFLAPGSCHWKCMHENRWSTIFLEDNFFYNLPQGRERKLTINIRNSWIICSGNRGSRPSFVVRFTFRMYSFMCVF